MGSFCGDSGIDSSSSAIAGAGSRTEEGPRSVEVGSHRELLDGAIRDTGVVAILQMSNGDVASMGLGKMECFGRSGDGLEEVGLNFFTADENCVCANSWEPAISGAEALVPKGFRTKAGVMGAAVDGRHGVDAIGSGVVPCAQNPRRSRTPRSSSGNGDGG